MTEENIRKIGNVGAKALNDKNATRITDNCKLHSSQNANIIAAAVVEHVSAIVRKLGGEKSMDQSSRSTAPEISSSKPMFSIDQLISRPQTNATHNLAALEQMPKIEKDQPTVLREPICRPSVQGQHEAGTEKANRQLRSGVQESESVNSPKLKSKLREPEFLAGTDSDSEAEPIEDAGVSQDEPTRVLAIAFGKDKNLGLKQGQIVEDNAKAKKEENSKLKITRYYTVQLGDCLAGIANRECGSEAYAPILFAWNPTKIELMSLDGKTYANPKVGSQLIIPDADQIASSQAAGDARLSDGIHFGPMTASADGKIPQESTETLMDQKQTVTQPVRHSPSPPAQNEIAVRLTKQPIERSGEIGLACSLQRYQKHAWVTLVEYRIFSCHSAIIECKTDRLKPEVRKSNLPPHKLVEMAHNHFRQLKLRA